jgi:hypothetical protein
MVHMETYASTQRNFEVVCNPILVVHILIVGEEKSDFSSR